MEWWLQMCCPFWLELLPVWKSCLVVCEAKLSFIKRSCSIGRLDSVYSSKPDQSFFIIGVTHSRCLQCHHARIFEWLESKSAWFMILLQLIVSGASLKHSPVPPRLWLILNTNRSERGHNILNPCFNICFSLLWCPKRTSSSNTLDEATSSFIISIFDSCISTDSLLLHDWLAWKTLWRESAYIMHRGYKVAIIWDIRNWSHCRFMKVKTLDRRHLDSISKAALLMRFRPIILICEEDLLPQSKSCSSL